MIPLCTVQIYYKACQTLQFLLNRKIAYFSLIRRKKCGMQISAADASESTKRTIWYRCQRNVISRAFIAGQHLAEDIIGRPPAKLLTCNLFVDLLTWLYLGAGNINMQHQPNRGSKRTSGLHNLSAPDNFNSRPFPRPTVSFTIPRL